MKQIPLTQGKFALVDDEDYERLMAMGKWCTCRGYAVKGLRVKNQNGKFSHKTIMMHREILNANNNLQVDHIDGNGLNNQKTNLRLCTNKENSMNQTKSKRNKGKFKGVHFNLKRKKFHSQICVSGKRIHLGSFDCSIEAARAYNAAAILHYGEFARLNEIPA